MRRVTYTDPDGRKWQVELPDGVPDSDASMGIAVGPPPLDALGYPRDLLIRLHNQLHDRGLLTAADANRRRQDVQGAIIGALKLDTQAIVDLYNAAAESSPSLPDPGAAEVRLDDPVQVVAPSQDDDRTKIPPSDVRARTGEAQNGRAKEQPATKKPAQGTRRKRRVQRGG